MPPAAPVWGRGKDPLNGMDEEGFEPSVKTRSSTPIAWLTIRASHADKFSLDMIEQPIDLFRTLHGNFFDLSCIEVQLQVSTPPELSATSSNLPSY